MTVRFLVCPPAAPAADSPSGRQWFRFVEMLRCAGDVLLDHVREICYAGYGWRTERSAVLQLHEILGCRVLPLLLADERFFHLNMALCPLTSGHVLVYMGAFSPHAQTLLRRTIGAEYLIEVGIDDALDLACNTLEVGRDALIMHRAGRGLRARLHDIGYRVFCTELDEFVRAGGSAKSLALQLDPVDVAVAGNTAGAVA